MASIPSDYGTATSYPRSQGSAGSKQAATAQAVSLQTSGAARADGTYASEAYQMTLGDASAARNNMQNVQAQSHMIEQLNAGFAGDEV